MKRLFVEFFCLLVTFFKVKKVGSNPTFYCFWTKEVASYEKNCKWKTSCKIKYVSKNFVNLSKYPPHPAFNFEVMKWCWTNFQMQKWRINLKWILLNWLKWNLEFYVGNISVALSYDGQWKAGPSLLFLDLCGW